MLTELDSAGYAMIPALLPLEECEQLAIALGSTAGPGRRGVLNTPAVSQLAASSTILDLVRIHCGEPPFAVRAIYFDKSPSANWGVSWHQDLTIAVRARVDAPGFTAWSVKAGVPHVQPPVEVLQGMLTVRLHLDDADQTNGALRVIPRTHLLGRLSSEQVEELRVSQAAQTCPARAGDAMLMRPLLLHASTRAVSAARRRVLHIEYAATSLPSGLQWHVCS